MSLSIISSKIVTAKHDAFWEQALPADLPAGPVSLLVLSLPYTPDSAEAQQLQKMIQACNVADVQVCIFQLENTATLPWHRLRDALQPKVVLLLGVLPAALGVAAVLPMYEPANFNGAIWISAHDLPTLAAQPEAKKQLWQNGLKPVFINQTFSTPA